MRYESPDSVESAVSILAGAGPGAKVLAGGTDLLVHLRAGTLSPPAIVDIKKIPEACEIRPENGGFRIGAAVSGAVLGEHASLSAAWPGVVEGAELIGSTQIQGRASMGGNLCNASPAADSVPALVAGSATARIAGPDGTREIPVEEVCKGPGQTTLGRGEFVLSIYLPERPPRSSDAYLRFIPRTEMDIAVVGAAVNVTLDEGGICTAARVVLGAVAPTVRIVQDAPAALVGTKGDEAALEALAAAARATCSPIDDKRGTIEYRTKVAGVLAQRAARVAWERASLQ